MDKIKLISGGQTGVDRAVLDFCLGNRVECGGWCPQDRKAEDGIIDKKYPLTELPGGDYLDRTRANVIGSDATVIIFMEEMEGGTLESYMFTRQEGKPFLLLDMSVHTPEKAAMKLRKFTDRIKPAILNFSGPRESEWRNGYSICSELLRKFMR
ncbi:MAG: putative molybdenum carrier protein [Bacteroidales bacterium]|nr:putative molybdenum carrier protein [Bacteroidales bacterium]